MKKYNMLIVFNAFWIFSMLYYLFGRYDWFVYKYDAIIYSTTAYLLFNIGFFLSSKFPMRHFTAKLSDKHMFALFFVSSISLVVFQILWVTLFLGSFSISDLFNLIGQNYYDRLSVEIDETVWYMQLRTVLWGLTLFAVPSGILLYRKMNLLSRMLFITAVITDVIASLNMGISKPIGDLLILVLMYSFTVKREPQKHRKKQFGRFVLFISASLIAALLFTINLNSRDSASNFVTNPFYRFANLNEHSLFDYFSFGVTDLANLIDRIGGYISHGYTGLAYALQVPFHNTYGVGFSRALTEYVAQYFGIDVSQFTYMYTIQAYYSWPNGMYWPTGFVWIASSVGFVGTLIVLFIFGWMYERIQRNYRFTGDVISLTLLWLMTITAFYLPANMQIFQSRSSFFGTVTVVMAYLFLRNRKHVHSID